MKKIFLLLVTPMFMVSCSDSDSESQEKLPVLTNVTFTSGETLNRSYELTYDNKRRVKMIKRNVISAGTFTFFYHSDNRIDYVTAEVNGAPTTFLYDDDKEITGFEKGGTEYLMSYDTTTHTFGIPNYGYFSFSPDGDLDQLNENWRGEYDNTKKGAFANANADYRYAVAFVDNYMRYFMSKKALVKRTTVDGSSDTYVNIYNEDGLISESQLMIDGTTPTILIKYEYEVK